MRLSNARPTTGRPWRASELRLLMKFALEVWNPAEMCATFSFYDLPRIRDPKRAAMLAPYARARRKIADSIMVGSERPLSSPFTKSRIQSEVGSVAMTTSAANSPSRTAIRPKASMASVRMTKTIALAASAASRGVP